MRQLRTLSVLDQLKRLTAMPNLVERRLEVLEREMQHVCDLLQRMTEDERRTPQPNVAVSEANARIANGLQERLEALEAALRAFQHETASVAESRHASIWQLLTDQHREVRSLVAQKSDDISRLSRHLKFTIADRFTGIERLLGSGTPQAGREASANPSDMAAAVHDFLGVTTDDDPPVVRRRAGSVELELPAWDNVVAPWLEEYEEWEPAVTQTLTQLVQPGFTVLDVGAHVGIFTLLVSRLVGPSGRVIALEPDPLNARFLRRNVMSAGCTNVLLLEVAAADRSRMLPLSRPSDDNTGDSRTYEVATNAELFFVNAIALDNLVPTRGRVDLVKLDLQGMDHVALRGTQRIMEEQHPTIILEFWPQGIRAYGDDPSDVIHWLRSLGDYSWTALELPDLTNACSDDEVRAAVEDLPDGYVNLLKSTTRKQPQPSNTLT